MTSRKHDPQGVSPCWKQNICSPVATSWSAKTHFWPKFTKSPGMKKNGARLSIAVNMSDFRKYQSSIPLTNWDLIECSLLAAFNNFGASLCTSRFDLGGISSSKTLTYLIRNNQWSSFTNNKQQTQTSICSSAIINPNHSCLVDTVTCNNVDDILGALPLLRHFLRPSKTRHHDHDFWILKVRSLRLILQSVSFQGRQTCEHTHKHTHTPLQIQDTLKLKRVARILATVQLPLVLHIFVESSSAAQNAAEPLPGGADLLYHSEISVVLLSCIEFIEVVLWAERCSPCTNIYLLQNVSVVIFQAPRRKDKEPWR